MDVKRAVAVIDTHTAGEPTRIVIGGAPRLRGSNILEKWADFRENHKDFRELLVREPRGHADMYGALLITSSLTDADFGVLFMDGGDSKSMCGHGSIGVARTLVELGMIPREEPVTTVNLETAAGIIRLEVEVQGGKVGDVVLRNVPSFVYKRNVTIDLPNHPNEITTDICFGGNFFAIVDAKDFDLTLRQEEAERIRFLGIEVLRRINQFLEVQHPSNPSLKQITNIVFSLELPGRITKNAEVGINGNMDRSPCGTGTCAKMALLAAKGILSPGEIFFHESLIGSVFTGFFEKGPVLGGVQTILPSIKGRSYVTGFNWLLDLDGDDLSPGFCFSGEPVRTEMK